MPDLFDSSTYTKTDKAAAIRRELGYRRRAYPRWVVEGRMKQEKADHEIAVFEAILADYERP
jgi:hypothetical protein